MKKKFLSFLCTVALCFGGAFALASCDDKPNDGDTPGGEQQATKLGTPFVSISASGLASWNAVSGALGYTYKINGGSEMNTTACSVQLTAGQSIVVMAVGDGISYSNSEYSSAQTFHSADGGNQGGSTDGGNQGGSTDGGSQDGGNQSGSTDGGSQDGGNQGGSTDGGSQDGGNQGGSTDGGSQDGGNQSGSTDGGSQDGGNQGGSTDGGSQDGGNQGGSEGTQQAVKLGTPFVSISANGLASWSAVTGAIGYTYVIDDGTPTNTVTCSIQLTDGQTIIVKAVGDGVSYTDSEYSAEQTYTEYVAPTTPTTIAVPSVTISASGLASWRAVGGATGYKYKIDGGAETSTTETSVQLSNGQSIVVKAVGDGNLNLDSAYSAVKTYVYQPTEVIEPSYLAIKASATAPLQSSGVPSELLSHVATPLFSGRYVQMYRDFNEAIEQYYTDTENYLGDTHPTASNFDLYAQAGQTVYVQIWLDNPAQHTILSLKLNGDKYQVGGGLSSFFINEGGVHYNCVYVAVPIPDDTYGGIAYEVTDIEYISGTYINQDGEDTFMNENDTVTIGLPYEEAMPTVAGYEEGTITVNSYEGDITVSDEDGLIAKSGGWLRAAIYDGYNVVAQQKAVVGLNEITVTGLVENTYYQAIIFLYADLHDGNGVVAHNVGQASFNTPPAITKDACEEVREYDASLDRHYSSIHVQTTLNSATAQYMRLEILENVDQPAIYVNESYDGEETITDGLHAGQGYTVRVYYKDTEYPDGKYLEESVWISYLYDVYLFDEEYYSLPNDLVFNFRLGSNDPHEFVQDFTLYLYDDNSPQYIAPYVLQLIDDPTLIETKNNRIQELGTLIRNLDWNAEGAQELYDQYDAERRQLNDEVYPLEQAKDTWDYTFSDKTEREYWQTEATKGQYYETLTYSRTGESDITRVGKKYYAVFSDYYNYPIHGNYFNMEMKIVANIDDLTGNGVQEKTFTQSMYDENRFADAMGDMSIKDVSMTDERDAIMFELVNGDLYNQVEGDGENLNLNVTYVYKITLSTDDYYWGDDGIVVYSLATVPTFEVDEDAWIAEYLAKVQAGESFADLAIKYAGKYEQVVQEIDPNILHAGNWYVRVFTRAYGREYDGDSDYVDKLISSEPVRITSKLPTPGITFGAYNGEVRAEIERYDGGGAEIPGLPQEYELEYMYSVRDTEGNPVVTDAVGASYAMYRNFGYEIRFKVRCTVQDTAWLESDWTEWTVFTGRKLDAPTVNYSFAEETASWDSDHYKVSGYVYKIGESGEEQTMLIDQMHTVPLANGETLFVKAIAKTEGEEVYADSDWGSYTVVDTRPKLATPQNFRYEDKLLCWDTVEGAVRYEIKELISGTVVDATGQDSHFVKGYGQFAVRAVPEDLNGTAPSEWSEPYVHTTTLADPTFNRLNDRGAEDKRLQWSSVEGAEEYVYRVNDGEEVSTGRYNYVNIYPLNLVQGDKVYVQARATGATSSGWSLVYTVEETLE